MTKKILVCLFLALALAVAAFAAPKMGPYEVSLENVKDINVDVDVEQQATLYSTTVSGTWGDNVSWNLNEYGTLTISGLGRISSTYELSIEKYPWESFKELVKHVIIEDGIVSIGSSAFDGFKNLVDVELPESLIEIDSYSFHSTALKYIELPQSLTLIGYRAFANTDILGVVIPNSIQNPTTLNDSIDDSFSLWNPGDIYSGTLVIYDGTEEEVIRKKLRFRNEYYYVSDLYKTDNGHMIIVDNELVCYTGYDKKITIPYGVEKIADEVFSYNNYLEEIIIPSSVIDIGDRTFLNCLNLSKISMPKSVKRIGYDCFWNTVFYNDETNWNSLGELWLDNFLIEYDNGKDVSIKVEPYCRSFHIDSNVVVQDLALSLTGLSGITVDSNHELYSSENGVLFNKDKSKLLLYCNTKENYKGTYIIPDSVEEIETNAFWNSTLSEIVLPQGLKIIGNKAFYRCHELKPFSSLPQELQEIGDSAFGSMEFDELIIPDGIKTIGSWGGKPNRIVLPRIITSIEENALNSVLEIVMPEYCERIDKRAFGTYSNYNLKQLDIPNGIKAIDLSNTSIETVILPITVNNISLPRTIKEIYYNGCKSRWDEGVLKNIDTSDLFIHFNEDDLYTPINEFVFEDAIYSDRSAFDTYFDSDEKFMVSKYLGEDSVVYIPDCFVKNGKIMNVCGISYNAFYNNQYIEKIVLPKDVFYIGSRSFRDCTNLKYINLENVRNIESQAFWGCSSLSNIKISDNLQNINSMVFYDTPLYDDPLNWCDGGFYIDDCLLDFKSNYKGSFSIKEGTRLIANNALSTRRTTCKITEIYVPESVEIIGESAFRGNSLENIYVSDQNKFFASDENGILYNKDFTTLICCPVQKDEILLHNNTSSIYSEALAGCNLKTIKIPGNVEINYDSFRWGEIETIILLEGRKYIGRVFQSLNTIKHVYLPKSLKMIDEHSFYNCPALTDVYYGGTEAEWNSIFIEEDGNDSLFNAIIHFETVISDVSYSDIESVADFLSNIGILSEEEKIEMNMYEDFDTLGNPIIDIKDLIKLAQMIANSIFS